MHEGHSVAAFLHFPVQGVEGLTEMEKLGERVDVKGLFQIADEVRKRLLHSGMALVLDEDKGRVRVLRKELLGLSREASEDYREERRERVKERKAVPLLA